ncbi:MAG TPA: O-antigen ligase family protein [Clostridiales bacterium]|nr:O-antigen ligase family protein [Clostridiales bacterium]
MNQNVAIKRRMDTILTGENIITYAAVSIFLPYVLTAIILIFLAVYILVNRQTRQLVFVHAGSNFLKMFCLYAVTIPVLYGNWKGMATGIGFALALVLGLFLRSVMTRERYERTLTLICSLSLTSAGFAFFEAFLNFVNHDGHIHRISAGFSHPNYFGSVAAAVIVVCAYKVFTSHESKFYFCLIAVANIISLYLCKSMFAFIEVFIGILVLLAVLKKKKLLALWLSAAVILGAMIFFFRVGLIPRLSDVEITVRLRQNIWRLAIRQIKEDPFFGHGFMSFDYLFDTVIRSRQVAHAHNIYLDMLLNFGVVGSLLFLGYFARYYLSVSFAWITDKRNVPAALILAITAANLVHGATDLTLLWIQTFPLFLIILSGQGAQEQRLSSEM